MTDLTLVTAGKIEIVQSLQQMTLGFAESMTPGQAARLDTSVGKWTKSNATSEAEARMWGVLASKDGAGAAGTVVHRGLLDGYDLSGLDYDADVWLSGTDGGLSDTKPGANEIQTVTIGGSPTGGTFDLIFDGQTAAGIAYNATAAAVEAALELLSTIGQGNVQVTGSAGGPYTVEFVGALAGKNQPAMTIDITDLTGGTPTGTIATATAGVSAVRVGRVVPGTAVNLGTAYDKLLSVEL